MCNTAAFGFIVPKSSSLSAVFNQTSWRVLKLTLAAEEWRSVFLAIKGVGYDASGGRCR